MPEKLVLKHQAGKNTTVDRYERIFSPGALQVNYLGKQFLACAAFSYSIVHYVDEDLL